mgnify:CR=1 FL=1
MLGPLQLEDEQGVQALDPNQLIGVFNANYVKEGCEVTYSGTGLDLDISSGSVSVEGSTIDISSQTISLSSADTENPRKDVISVDGSGSVNIYTGLPETPTPNQADRFDTARPVPADMSNLNEVVLAEVWVGEDVSSLSSADIRDRRIVEPAVGGMSRVSAVDSLITYKKSFNSIRNRASWIEHILNNEESIADEVTSSQVLTHYVFEAENDAYDRFIDPNHNLGLFAYNNDSEPVLSSLYEASMFLAPTSFYEGLMTIESVADTISNSELLMDAVMTGDNILENQFGREVNA